MIVFELTGAEEHPEYKSLENSNLIRQLNFLESVANAAIRLDRKFLSQTIIKALNYHALACLHVNAGEYRPCKVGVNGFTPPEHYRVQALMDDFVNIVNENWWEADVFALSAYVYWRINHIHPFINGNGRTARACCYFVLCVKAGGMLRGSPILPELLKDSRRQCVELLRQADTMHQHQRPLVEIITPLKVMIRQLVTQQMSTIEPQPPPR